MIAVFDWLAAHPLAFWSAVLAFIMVVQAVRQ